MLVTHTSYTHGYGLEVTKTSARLTLEDDFALTRSDWYDAYEWARELDQRVGGKAGSSAVYKAMPEVLRMEIDEGSTTSAYSRYGHRL